MGLNPGGNIIFKQIVDESHFPLLFVCSDILKFEVYKPFILLFL
jgi:hypothetical protein